MSGGVEPVTSQAKRSDWNQYGSPGTPLLSTVREMPLLHANLESIEGMVKSSRWLSPNTVADPYSHIVIFGQVHGGGVQPRRWPSSMCMSGTPPSCSLLYPTFWNSWSQVLA